MSKYTKQDIIRMVEGCRIYPSAVYGYVWHIKKCGSHLKPVREGFE